MISSKSKDILFIVFLARIQFLTMAEKLRLFNVASDAEFLSKLNIDDLSYLVKRNLHATYNGQKNLQQSLREVDILTNKKIGVITCKDAAYPKKLLAIKDPPFALFYKGNLSLLETNKSVAIVGTRHITPEASCKTKKFAYDAVCDGCTVISGLANGADGAAHSGAMDAYFDALENGQKVAATTVAVLPCSVDTVTPRNHLKLANDILMAGGCLVSESTPLIEIKKWNFATRNRIIAALGDATVVTQAPPASGALITASYAAEYGKPLFFHSAAFSTQAQQVEQAIVAKLEKDYEAGRLSREKLQNNCRKYIDNGAAVVTSYSDYVNHMNIARNETLFNESLYTKDI